MKLPLAIALASMCLVMLIGYGSMKPADFAYAEGLTAPTLDGIQQTEIQVLESAYREAEQHVAEAKARVAENQAKVDAIMRKLPAQQERADDAIRELYIMEENKLSYVEVLLSSDTLDTFFKRIEYHDRVSRRNLAELNKLKAMLAELEEARILLDAAQAEAEELAQRAHDALEALQNQRSSKQATAQASSLAQDNNSAILDGADWHMTEEEFVATWAPRIDAYLEGSPMAGTGATFATASFRYCVDPRWSPAISNTESGKGSVCIRPYNAWGWGAADSDPYNLAAQWGSWEEGIEAHIRGLANGYGYTISKSAAEKYCSSPDSWYANTLSEMARI